MSHHAPVSVRREFVIGLKLYNRGLGGDGLRPETVEWARRIASGHPVTDEKIQLMFEWFKRHVSEKEVEARHLQMSMLRAGTLTKKAPALVAWLLWGGESGRDWANRMRGRPRENPTQLDHCVERVLEKLDARGETPSEATSRAFAICTANLQRAGRMYPGTRTLTPAGEAAERQHRRHDQKDATMFRFAKKTAKKARRNPSMGKLIYLTPAAKARMGRAVRRNPYEPRGKYAEEGLQITLLRGPRKGTFKVLGRGTGSTKSATYAKRKVGTYAVQYEGKSKEKYLPTRYLSQLLYRTTDKGMAAAKKAAANYRAKHSKKTSSKKAPRKPSLESRIDNLQRAYEAAVMAGNKKKTKELLASLQKARAAAGVRSNPYATRTTASKPWWRMNPSGPKRSSRTGRFTRSR